jgi:hypothetical protein
MMKQSVSFLACALILSACASTQVPTAQTVAVESTISTTEMQTSPTDSDAPQASVTRVFWFFGDR